MVPERFILEREGLYMLNFRDFYGIISCDSGNKNLY